MKLLKLVSNTALLVMLLFLGYSFASKKGIFSETRKVMEATGTSENQAEIGGDFSLTNQDGKVVNSVDMRGKHMLVMFGFSSCQSICPIELSLVSHALENLGEKAKDLQVVFITVDPQRDTVGKLHDYHKNYDSRIQMLTGEATELVAVAAQYKVYLGEAKDEHSIDHSSIMYLMGKDGKYLSHFAPDLKSQNDQAGALLKMLNESVVS